MLLHQFLSFLLNAFLYFDIFKVFAIKKIKFRVVNVLIYYNIMKARRRDSRRDSSNPAHILFPSPDSLAKVMQVLFLSTHHN